jgi:hypothetical protein
MDLHQGIVKINELDQPLVVVDRTGEKLCVHPRAVGAFEIVEVDDGNLRRRIAAGWAALDGQRRGRISAEIPLRKPRQRISVLRKQKIDGLIATRLAGQ